MERWLFQSFFVAVNLIIFEGDFTMLSRKKLENNQVLVYICTLVIAVGFGLLAPNISSMLDVTISVVIGLLMYSMFSQIPFMSLKDSLSNRRFMIALCIVNYIAVPIVVWLLALFLPDYSPLLLGVYLVLLTPCIDYVIVFTALGRGNEKAMLIATPILFITQMLLLPIYLWLFIGEEASKLIEVTPFVEAFLGLIVLPLGVAIGIQLLAKKKKFGNQLLEISAWLPVPFMALTLFVVVASQINKLTDSVEWIVTVIPLYIAFMVIMPFISKLIGKWMKLDVKTGRALIFSGSTRNSLVVLPFALALPSEVSTIVAAIIVTQTIVEIIGELLYIRLIPNVVLRD